MNKLKLYIVLALFALLCGMVIALNIYRTKFLQEQMRAERLALNQAQLINESSNYKRLYLTQKEFTVGKDARIDSLLAELKVKPKQVTRYVERWHYSVDTIVRIDTLIVLPDNYTWPFADTTNCFMFAGNIKIGQEVIMEVNRREYTNKTTEVAYLERSKRFLGIKYGPFVARLYVKNTCGGDIVKDIEVIKK
jgi:hypothetical protein